MTKREAKLIALEDAAMNIEGSAALIEQRHPDKSDRDREKIERAYDDLAQELRRRTAPPKTAHE